MIIKRDRVRIVDTCIQQWRNSYEAVPFAALRPLATTSAAYTTAHELSYGDTQYIRGRPALVHCELWWKGPAWLSQDMGVWPVRQTPEVGEMPEERKCGRTLLTTTELDFSLLKRFSSLIRAIRVTAYCLRFF